MNETLEKTRTLILRAQQGDLEAKELLVEQNLGLVWSLVKRFSNRGYDLDDLFQVGSIGLLKSIEKFDLKYQVAFSTYAVPMIVGEIKRFLRDDGIIKVSRSLKDLASKARSAKEEFQRKANREPTLKEISDILNIPAEEIAASLEANSEVESLNAVINPSSNTSITLAEKIDQSPDEQKNIFENIFLKEIISTLSVIERQIINYRYFEDLTQLEIATRLGVSQVQISRIEKRVLEKLRQSIEPS
ncbi:RNA polymerase sigma-G factor [Epulopiscium sp. SCG-B10WGA-EpuloA2]|nr:RNA polymerase sigma-G factor [Epulopiscium sp. SCG-B10WGA-EpuloA2]